MIERHLPMLFNSHGFIYIFLPVTFAVYFILNHNRKTVAGKIWLVLASIFFYGYWKPSYVILLICSILFNFIIGRTLYGTQKAISNAKAKSILIIGLAGNIILLCYFKYLNFILSNLACLSKVNFPYIDVMLPLGISFFTFTQIAYLVDTYHSKAREYSILNYFLFVTYFPHLLAGPIIHHKDMMPQFDNLRNKIANYRNIIIGLFIFFVGLFKKVIIADSFAIPANSGFANASNLSFIDAWVTSLSYTLQLYFDFSGYTDMAIGSSLLFNIRLPINFNSPYRAINIQDFWRRWHITLSRFLKDYVYIPLGGNRTTELHTLSNLLFTFLIGGIWHGAGWTFVIWGILHGAAVVVHRTWRKLHIDLPDLLAWLITFNFVNIAWIFFRARSLKDATTILRTMTGMNGFAFPPYLETKLSFLRHLGIKFDGVGIGLVEGNRRIVCLLPIFILLSTRFMTSNDIEKRYSPSWSFNLALIMMAMFSITSINTVSEFIYFNF